MKKLTQKIIKKHLDSEEAGEGIVVVQDEEIVAVGAFDFGDGVTQRVTSVKVLDVFV